MDDVHRADLDPCFPGAFTPEAGIGTILITEVDGRLTGQQARRLVVETSSRSEYADRIILTKRFHQVSSPTRAGSSIS